MKRIKPIELITDFSIPYGKSTRRDKWFTICHVSNGLRDALALAAAEDMHKELADMLVSGASLAGAYLSHADKRHTTKSTLIGYLAYFPNPTIGRINLLSVVVHPRYRSRGAAGMLVSSLLRAAREHADTYYAVHLIVASNNDPALKLYRKFGFTGKSVMPDYFDWSGNGDHWMQMECIVSHIDTNTPRTKFA